MPINDERSVHCSGNVPDNPFLAVFLPIQFFHIFRNGNNSIKKCVLRGGGEGEQLKGARKETESESRRRNFPMTSSSSSLWFPPTVDIRAWCYLHLKRHLHMMMYATSRTPEKQNSPWNDPELIGAPFSHSHEGLADRKLFWNIHVEIPSVE